MFSPFQRRLVALVLGAPALLLGSLAWLAWRGSDGGGLNGQGRAPDRVGSRLPPGGLGEAAGAEFPSSAPEPLARGRQPSSTPVRILDRTAWTRRDSAAEGGVAADPTARSSTAPGGSGLDARDFATLEPRHQEMVMRLLMGENEGALGTADGPVLLPEVCFSAGTRPQVVRAFAAARLMAEARRFHGGVAAAATQLGSRWTQTATVSSGFSQGDPTTLTWSVVPDGTNIPGSGGGEAASPSDLRAWLNARYGSQSVWLPLLAQVFDRWSELSGVSYVHESNDDGASFPGSAGELGVRGDIRLSGHPVDGNFDILAYNYFPQQGDMVLDTADSFFADTSGDSEKLRTVISHEHGHGLGLRHVCPVNATKLMEPFIDDAVSGPELDDTYSVQRHYGDRFEPNNSRSAPHELGTLPAGETTLPDLSVDDNSDIDFLRFAPPHDGFLLSVTLRPVGASYPEAAQDSDGSCPSGSTFNSLTKHNLNLELRDADGLTVLVAADSHSAGQAETFSDFPLPDGSGPFFLRVIPATTTNGVQLYELEVTLVDAGTPRVLSVGDVTVGEGVGTATLTVSVAPAAWESIQIPWQVSGGTATAAADFAAPGGTAVIPAGAVSTTLTIPIFEDALDEDDEVLSVQLATPSNAVLADGSAVVTILDNDPLPTLTVVAATTAESSGQPVSFSATLSAPSGRDVRVDWTTAAIGSTPNPAQSGLDYLLASGTLTLAAGETSGVLGPITVLDDILAEADEVFALDLTAPVNLTLAAPTTAGRIDDDDAPLALAQTGSFTAPDAEGHPVIAWEGVVGRRYRVETSSDLQTWTPLPGDSTLTATQTALSFADTSTAGSPRKYYRVLDLPP